MARLCFLNFAGSEAKKLSLLDFGTVRLHRKDLRVWNFSSPISVKMGNRFPRVSPSICLISLLGKADSIATRDWANTTLWSMWTEGMGNLLKLRKVDPFYSLGLGFVVHLSYRRKHLFVSHFDNIWRTFWTTHFYLGPRCISPGLLAPPQTNTGITHANASRQTDKLNSCMLPHMWSFIFAYWVALETKTLLSILDHLDLIAAEGRNLSRKGWDGQRSHIGYHVWWKSVLDLFGRFCVSKDNHA